MPTFSDILISLRKQNKLTQRELAEKLGLTTRAIQYYEAGRQPEWDIVIKVADFFKVSTDYLFLRTPSPNLLSDLAVSDHLRVPVVGSIRAGEPIDMISEDGEYEMADSELVRGHDAFLLRVKGDSMIGDNIFEGDRVLVIATCDFSPSDICVVAIDGREATLKRVKCHGGVCVLTPSNTSMEPMVYSAGEIHVIGVVVEVRHRMRRK